MLSVPSLYADAEETSWVGDAASAMESVPNSFPAASSVLVKAVPDIRVVDLLEGYLNDSAAPLELVL